MSPNRYLVSFDARHAYHQFTDVLVIGAGIAGIRAALEIPSDLNVLVLNKDRLDESNSSYAQGGIAGVMSPEDTFDNHIEDTLVAGAGLCERAVVEMVVREAPHQISDLIRFGVNFDLEGTVIGASFTPSATPLGSRSCGRSSPARRRRRTSPFAARPSPWIC
jgi:L-aspartate oxidase